MNIPCDKAIRCPGPTSQGYDYPVANFSSERPDQNIIPSINYDGTPVPIDGSPGTWATKGCVSWCISNISQADADLCAARQAILCVPGPEPVTPTPDNPNPPPVTPGPGPTPNPFPGPGPGPVPNPNPGPGPVPGTYPTKYGNTPQTCTLTCPNGEVFTETIAAGQVIGSNQSEADSIAYSLACKAVQNKIICTTSLSGFYCADPFFDNLEYEFAFEMTTGSPPVTWSVVGGSLPPGLVLETNGELHGFPYMPGFYNFTVRGTNAAGAFSDSECTFEVLGLNLPSPTLDPAGVDNAYSLQLDSGGTGISYWISDGSLPNGITLSDSGLLTGTPDTVGTSTFVVAIEDSFTNVCTYELTLRIKGPKITCPAPGTGTVCTNWAGGNFSAVPAGCTFSGTPPSSLTMNAAGVVSGVPSSEGTLPFVVTVFDPASGDTNTRSCDFVIAADGTGVAKALEDTGVWTESLVGGQPAGTVYTGSIDDGSGVITVSRPVGSGAGTSYHRYATVLSKCAAEPSYKIYWTLSLLYQQTNPDITNNIQLWINNTQVYVGGGGTTGFSTLGDVDIVNDTTAVNTRLDLQLGSSKIATDAFTGVVTLTMSPLRPN